MNYAHKLKTSTKLKAIVLSLVGVASLLVLQGTAKALAPVPTNTLPESSDFTQGNDVWVTVANADGSNFLLNAHTGVIRIYTPNPSITLHILNGRQCLGSGIDQGDPEGTAVTKFEFHSLSYRAIATGAWQSAPYQDEGEGSAAPSRSSFQLGCGTTNVPLTNTYTPVPLNAGSNEYAQRGKYAFEIRAIWQNLGAYGWNQFRYSVDNGQGRLSYYAGAGDHFALKADNNSANTGDFQFGFAPNCQLTSSMGATNAVLNWFDADAGQSNQGGESPVKTAVFQFAPDGTQTPAQVVLVKGGNSPFAGEVNITTGNDQPGSVTIVIKPHYKYKWIWYHIYTNNGIQFSLPTDSYNTLINFDNDCDNQPKVPQATCSAAPSSALLPINPLTGATVKVRVTNTSGAGGPIFNGNYEVRQVPNNNPPAGYTSPSPGGGTQSLSGNLPPGSTDANIPRFTISARATAQKIRFYYALFDPSGTAVGNNPLCFADITWRAGPPPGPVGGGQISADCSSTVVSGVSAPGTTYHMPWSPIYPPSDLNPATGRRITASPITKVPVAIRITEVGNPGNTFTKVLTGGVDNGGGFLPPMSTYDLWGGMWLHKSYTLELLVQGTTGGDSTAYNNDGAWGPPFYSVATSDSATTPTDCMDASCGVLPGNVDAEPGQTKTLNYGIRITNNSQRGNYSANDGGGYHFVVGSSSGLANVGGPTPTPGNIAPGESVPMNVSFPARIDYGNGSSTGQYWITMYFQGSPLSLPGLQSPCPQASVTPATRAFFEVRQGDISAGGGFKDATDVCPTSAPGYVSPATGYSSSSARYDYAGGIRAYGNPNGARGSEAEFGALSLGLTIGSPNGPIGFFSGHNELFANSGVNPPHSDSLGGYLSPSGATQAHCVNDFFTKTRITGTTPAAFTGNSVTGLSGQYESLSGLTIHASNINPGQRLTLYVAGNVIIDGNINYAKTWNPADRKNVPYFSLIVKGNITLTGGVSELDGLYVAQPDNPSNGIFKTCDDFCAGQLVVNGAVIAQSVQLTRAHGSLGPCDAASPTCSQITGNPAEIFNYVPSMLIGLPNFNPLDNGTEALFSLPPVF